MDIRGPRPAGTTVGCYLDIGNYEHGNCEWPTKVEQMAERRGKNAMLKYRQFKSNAAQAA
jgi:hypothetical protein